jgi:hypothetical protein
LYSLNHLVTRPAGLFKKRDTSVILRRSFTESALLSNIYFAATSFPPPYDFAKEESRETSVQGRESLNQLPATSYFSQCFNDFANHQSREFTRIKVTGYEWLLKSYSTSLACPSIALRFSAICFIRVYPAHPWFKQSFCHP